MAMRLAVIGIALCLTALLGACAERGDTLDRTASLIRDDLYHITLSDGAQLIIRTKVYPLHQLDTYSGVSMVVYPRGTTRGDGRHLWEVELTSVEVPLLAVTTRKPSPYYALVRVVNDRIFIFFTWNGLHFMIDNKTGRIIEKGKGDDVLREYASFEPLKLVLEYPVTSEWRPLTEREKDLFRQWKVERREREGRHSAGERER
jgi:hypothetical protein